MYSVLFFLIRRQTREMRTTNHSNDFYKSQQTLSDGGTTHESDPWRAYLDPAKSSAEGSEIVVTPSTSVTNGEQCYPVACQSTQLYVDENAKKRMNSVATTLLCYPIAYICIIMPITASRIAQFTGAHVPLPVIYFTAGFYASTGYVNVIMYTVTRKGIISWDWLFRLVGRRRNELPQKNTIQLGRTESSSCKGCRGT